MTCADFFVTIKCHMLSYPDITGSMERTKSMSEEADIPISLTVPRAALAVNSENLAVKDEST